MRSSVLVTGGAGYVGSALVNRLLQKGVRVRVLDRLLFGDAHLAPWQNRVGFDLMVGDVRDRSVVQKATEGCSAVVHLAGISDPQSYNWDSQLARSINLDGLSTVFHCAASEGVEQFLQVTHVDGEVGGSSSVAITEARDFSAVQISESQVAPSETDRRTVSKPCSPCHWNSPQSAFTRCELARECLLERHANRDMSVTTLCTPTLAGLSPRMRFDLPVHSFSARAFLHCESEQRAFSQIANGIHLNDLLDLMMNLLEWNTDLCDGATLSLSRHTLSKTSSPSFQSSLEDLPGHWLGWHPRRTVDLAYREIIARMQQNDFADALTNPQFHNVMALRSLDRGALRRAA